MADTASAARTPKPEPDWELVLKRNPVERSRVALRASSSGSYTGSSGAKQRGVR